MVKRYIADVATCVDVTPVESVSGAKFVLATDYATLEAENAKLRAELERQAVPDGWRELLQEVAEYAPPYGTIVAMTSQMALGSKARRMLAAAPSAPKADDPVKAQLLEALEFAARSLATMTSADGSGHADIALCVLRMAGYATDERERIVDMWKHDRQWPTDAIAAARKGEWE